MIFTLRKGDTLPPINSVLVDENGPYPLDPSDEVYLVIDGREYLAQVVDYQTSEVIYMWTAANVKTAGRFSLFWRVKKGGAASITFPNYEEFYLEVRG